MKDHEVAREKVRKALVRKSLEMCPCTKYKWWKALERLGIETELSAGGWDRPGFMRVTDPVGVVIGTDRRHGVLYVPDGLAEKILALGGLP